MSYNEVVAGRAGTVHIRYAPRKYPCGCKLPRQHRLPPVAPFLWRLACSQASIPHSWTILEFRVLFQRRADASAALPAAQIGRITLVFVLARRVSRHFFSTLKSRSHADHVSERVSGVVVLRHRASQRTSIRGIINKSRIARRYVLLHVLLRHLADCKLHYPFIVGLIASGSRHLMPQHEGCNIGVSP